MIRPLPVPPPATLIVNGPLRKRVLTVRDWLIVTLHVPVPEHPLLNQPRNACPAFGLAVRVTTAP